jgi:hypothetical protein
MEPFYHCRFMTLFDNIVFFGIIHADILTLGARMVRAFVLLVFAALFPFGANAERSDEIAFREAGLAVEQFVLAVNTSRTPEEALRGVVLARSAWMKSGYRHPAIEEWMDRVDGELYARAYEKALRFAVETHHHEAAREARSLMCKHIRRAGLSAPWVEQQCQFA